LTERKNRHEPRVVLWATGAATRLGAANHDREELDDATAALPTIGGTAEQGITITSDPGTCRTRSASTTSGRTVTPTAQLRAYLGGDGHHYVLAISDVGRTIVLRVTAFNTSVGCNQASSLPAA
jgi:hypothetical protein